jgi:hypothetical protein
MSWIIVPTPPLGAAGAAQSQPDAAIRVMNMLGKPLPALTVSSNTDMTKLPLMFVSETCEKLA